MVPPPELCHPAPVESINADILSSTVVIEPEGTTEEEKKEKEGEEVADSAADLLAKTKSAKSSVKKSNALQLAFKQALMAKKGPIDRNAASNKDIEKFLEKVRCLLDEKIRCDQKGEVTLMRDTDVKNPHLQALSFRAKSLLKMAKHNLMQIQGPSGFRPVAVVQPASSSSPASSAPSNTTASSSSSTASLTTTTATTTPAVQPVTIQPSAVVGSVGVDSSADTFAAQIKQHEEAIKRLEDQRVAETAAKILAKIRKKSGPTDSDQTAGESGDAEPSTEPAAETGSTNAEPQPIVIAPETTGNEAAEVKSGKPENKTGGKKSQMQKNLAKLRKMNIPQDKSTKLTAAALLAKIKAKKSGGSSPVRPSSNSSAESDPIPTAVVGQVAMVDEWPPTQAQAEAEKAVTIGGGVGDIASPAPGSTTAQAPTPAPPPPTEEQPPPPPEPEPEGDTIMEVDMEDTAPAPMQIDATTAASQSADTTSTVTAQQTPTTTGALSSISGAPVSYPVPAPPLPPTLTQPSSTQGYVATSQPAVTSQTATSVATSDTTQQQHAGWGQSQQSWFQHMSQNMDATTWQQWQQWANSHGYQWPGYQQQGPPDPSAWQKAFENLSKVVGEEKPAWWSGPWPPHPNQHPHQQWGHHGGGWGQQGWGDHTGWGQQGWGSGWESYDPSYDPSQYGYGMGPPGVGGGETQEDSTMYEDEPPPPGHENMPAFSTGLGAPKPPPQHRRNNTNTTPSPYPPSRPPPPAAAPPPHVPSLIHDIDVSKPPPPFVPHGHDIPGGGGGVVGRGKDAGRGRGRGNSPTAVMSSPWDNRGGRGGRGGGVKEHTSPPAMPSPWDAAKGGINVEKLHEMTAAQGGNSAAPEPEERVEPLGLNVKIYVLNADAPPCKSVEVC